MHHGRLGLPVLEQRTGERLLARLGSKVVRWAYSEQDVGVIEYAKDPLLPAMPRVDVASFEEDSRIRLVPLQELPTGTNLTRRR